MLSELFVSVTEAPALVVMPVELAPLVEMVAPVIAIVEFSPASMALEPELVVVMIVPAPSRIWPLVPATNACEPMPLDVT